MNTENKCKDCTNLSARDVFSGVCIAQNKPVAIDGAACGEFAAARRCKYCAGYVPSVASENLGVCKDNMVYPDLGGCEEFIGRA